MRGFLSFCWTPAILPEFSAPLVSCQLRAAVMTVVHINKKLWTKKGQTWRKMGETLERPYRDQSRSSRSLASLSPRAVQSLSLLFFWQVPTAFYIPNIAATHFFFVFLFYDLASLLRLCVHIVDQIDHHAPRVVSSAKKKKKKTMKLKAKCYHFILLLSARNARLVKKCSLFSRICTRIAIIRKAMKKRRIFFSLPCKKMSPFSFRVREVDDDQSGHRLRDSSQKWRRRY